MLFVKLSVLSILLPAVVLSSVSSGSMTRDVLPVTCQAACRSLPECAASGKSSYCKSNGTCQGIYYLSVADLVLCFFNGHNAEDCPTVEPLRCNYGSEDREVIRTVLFVGTEVWEDQQVQDESSRGALDEQRDYFEGVIRSLTQHHSDQVAELTSRINDLEGRSMTGLLRHRRQEDAVDVDAYAYKMSFADTVPPPAMQSALEHTLWSAPPHSTGFVLEDRMVSESAPFSFPIATPPQPEAPLARGKAPVTKGEDRMPEDKTVTAPSLRIMNDKEAFAAELAAQRERAIAERAAQSSSSTHQPVPPPEDDDDETTVAVKRVQPPPMDFN